jgi:drug/metabolite transporter (DMT)-like permease
MTGIGAALFCSRPDPDHGTRAMSALSGAGLLFGLAFVTQALRTHALPPFSLSAAVLDGTLALLTMVVLARLGATRWTAQFTLAPLVILLEGIVILRPRMDPRTVTGLILLAVASLFLLLPQTDDDDHELLD